VPKTWVSTPYARCLRFALPRFCLCVLIVRLYQAVTHPMPLPRKPCGEYDPPPTHTLTHRLVGTTCAYPSCTQAHLHHPANAHSHMPPHPHCRFWHDEKRFKGTGETSLVQRALLAAGGVRTGGNIKSARTSGLMGCVRRRLSSCPIRMQAACRLLLLCISLGIWSATPLSCCPPYLVQLPAAWGLGRPLEPLSNGSQGSTGAQTWAASVHSAR